MKNLHEQHTTSLSSRPRLAAIDIGSNSLRLVVAQMLSFGGYKVLDEERHSTRLARSLESTGHLDPAAVDDSINVLRHFRKIATGHGVCRIRSIATCAVRESTNGKEFCRRAEQEAGLPVEVIDSRQEAELAFLSVKEAFDISDQSVAVADIGGGSTEVILALGGHVEEIYSTSLGAVRLFEKAGCPDQSSGQEYLKLVRAIDDELKHKIKRVPFAPQVLIGSGGTFSNLAGMVMAAKGEAGQPISGFRVSRAEVRHLLDRLRKMTLKQRRSFPGLSSHRADIIVAGLAIIDRIMHRLQVNFVRVHSRGVRDGLLLKMIGQMRSGAQAPRDRRAVIDEFVESCGVDLAHARQVARLAVQLFDQLADRYALVRGDRILLESAALLEDVGYLINFETHHKHSYQLILNSQLPGFDRHQLELIANIARYHRGARPKRKHAQFRQLSPVDQQRVRQLAAILRLAGGLDRSHRQRVESARAHVRDEQTLIEVEAEGDTDVDIWAALRRAGLFERVFQTRVSIRPASRTAALIEPSTHSAR